MALNDVGVRLVAESEQAFISALDNAAGAVKNLTDQAAGGFGFTAAADQADELATAIGVRVYDAIKSVITGLKDMGIEAFNTIADFERTTQSIEAMMAIEIGMGQTVTDVSEAVYELTAADIEEARVFDKAARGKEKSVDGIRDAIDKLNKEVAKDSSNEDLPQRARLEADLQDALLETTRIQDKAAAIRSKHGETFKVETKRQINQVNDINEAMRLAKKPADEMLESLTRMALQSPFERKPILDVMKQGQAFGFTADESLKATEAFIKFATVTGRNEGHITRLGYAMGQMKSQGKVMTRQLRQMNMAGMGMNQMAEAMGMSTEDFTAAVSKGKIPFEEFNERLMEMVDTKYTPAYKQINESFFGLQNAIKDINKLSLAAFFEGTMEAGKGIMIELVRPFTEGDALNAIKGFGDRIGEYLAPGLKVVADKVGLVMQGFMDLSTMINGPVNKEFTNATDEAGHAKKIIGELGVALNNTAGDGMSQSRAFADLTAQAGFAKTAQANLKDQIIVATGVNKAAEASHTALSTIYKDEVKKIAALEKANKTGTREYASLTAAHAKTAKSLDELNSARSVTFADLNKLTDKEKTNNAELAKSEKALAALGGAAKNLSPQYQLLIDKKKLLEAAGSTENETYKGIVAEMKRMEDGTVTYVETSKSLSETTELSKELADKLAAATIEQDKLKAAAGPIPESFMSKIIASFDEFIDKNGPVAAILLSLEDIFLKIKKKVTDAWEATKTFIQGIDPKKSGLWIVNDALKGLRDNFDKIWHVGENVVKVVVGLAFLNRIAGFAMTAATALGFFLTPLGLITGAVGLLTWEYDKGNKGVVDFVDKNKASLDGWAANTKKMFDASTGEGKLFRQNVQEMKNGVNRIFESEFSTKLPVDMAIADMRRVNAEGFEDIKTGITNVGIQFGILPSTMDKIADLILVPIATIKGIIQGIYVAFKLGVIDEIVKLWKSNPGSKEAQGAADKITEILKKLLPEGWAENIETAVGKVTTIIQTLRWAFDKLKESLLAIQSAFKPVITFLSENREKILPVLIALAEITAAVWLLNGALVAVTGVSLASLATGIAPAAADAGALANLQLMRGKMGVGTQKASGTPTDVMSLFRIDESDLAKLADARTKLAGATDDVKTLTGRLDELAKIKAAPLIDEAGFLLLKQMPGMAAADEAGLALLRNQFVLTGDDAAAAMAKIDDEIIFVQNALKTSSTLADDFGKVVVRQEALTGGVFQRIATKTKDSFSGVTDLITTTSTKVGGLNTQMGTFLDKANVKTGTLHDLWDKIAGKVTSSFSMDLPADVATRTQPFDYTSKPKAVTQLDNTPFFDLKAAQANDDAIKQLRIQTTLDSNATIKQLTDQHNTEVFNRYKQMHDADVEAFTKTLKTKTEAQRAQSALDLDFFKQQNMKYIDEVANYEMAAFEATLKDKAAKGLASIPTSVPDALRPGGALVDDAAKMAGLAPKLGTGGVGGFVDDAFVTLLNKGKTGVSTVMTTIGSTVKSGASAVWSPLAGGFDDLFLKAIPKLVTGGIGGIWALIKAPFLAIAASGGLWAFLTGIFAAGSGGFIAAIMAPLTFVVSEFLAILGFIGTIFSAIGVVITSPISWAILAVVAIMWGLYYDIGGITTAITEFLYLLLSPIYMLWNGFLVLSDVVTYVMMAIWDRMVSVWESAIKPVFTMFNRAIAITFDWMTWLLWPFIMFYNFIVKVLVPIIAIVFYGTMMAAWYVIEIVIEVVMFIIRVFFGFFQAIYSVNMMVIELINWIWETIGAGQFFRDLWKSLMDKIGGAKTSSTFTTVISWLTYFYNKIQNVVDVIKMLIKNFKLMGEVASYDWVGYGVAKVKEWAGNAGAVAEFEKEKGVAPTLDFTVEWTPDVTAKDMEAAVTGLWEDLTGDKVREPGADASTLEKVWLMATNMMKSPEAKKDAEDAKQMKQKNADAAAAKATTRDAGYEAKETAASDAARIAAMNTRTASLQTPITKAPAAPAGKTTKSFMMGTEGGIDPTMMKGRTKGNTGYGLVGRGYVDNSRQSQSAVSITNNNAGAPPNVSNQVGAALSAQWAAQSESQGKRYNLVVPPVSQTMAVAGAPS